MNFRQLTFAREFRGITQTELASRIDGLSQSNLSKFEKGIGIISDDLLERIMDYLDFPMSFLSLSIEPEISSSHFRKRATITAKDKGIIFRTISLIAHTYDKLAECINFPEFKFRQIDLSEGYKPEDAAKQVRRQFALGSNPLSNIYHFIEQNGISIYNWDCSFDQFDGVSLMTDNGYIIMIVNSKRSPDRIRYTLAHELGHVIMHLNRDFIIHPERDLEKEANRFAAELLMPESAIASTLCNLKMKDVAAYKRYWLTSMAAIIERAKALNAIAPIRYKTLRTELSRNGWLKNEPVMVDIDSPVTFKKAYELMKSELDYCIEDFEKIMKLPRSIIEDLYETKVSIKLSLCRN